MIPLHLRLALNGGLGTIDFEQVRKQTQDSKPLGIAYSQPRTIAHIDRGLCMPKLSLPTRSTA